MIIKELIEILEGYPEDFLVVHSIGCLIAEPVTKVKRTGYIPGAGITPIDAISLHGAVASINKWWEKADIEKEYAP